MTDETPQNPREGLPPVRMALRVIGRHGHRGGPHLARAVAGARAPKHLEASTRLARHAEPEAAPAPPAVAAPAPAAQPALAAPAAAWTPGVDSPADPSLSDFAREFLFGDAVQASAGLTSMSAASQMRAPESAKEARLARRKARGALDVSRAAKILEGASAGVPERDDDLALPDQPAPAGPVAASAGAKVSRTPSDPPKPPNAPVPLPKPPEEPPPIAATAEPPAAAPAAVAPAPQSVARAPRA